MPRISLLVLLFGVGLLPFAAQFVVHHPDERYYTDAAIAMLQGGDYLVPQHADGSPRFEKPIFTYWVVAGSYTLLGVNPLASRLPFLLAGCAALWLTYRLALLLFADPAVARLSALIWLCHPLLLLSATRSMPDILLCLFLLATAYGLLAVLLAERSPSWHLYLLAYGGAGLAAATKGLPVLALVLFTAAFARFNPWRPRSLRVLLHGPSMALGLLLAAGWFLLLDSEQRVAAIQVCWEDQVTNRISADYSALPEQFAVALAGMALSFLPWAVPLLFARREAPQPADKSAAELKHRLARRFICAWTLFMTLLMSVTVKFSVRYLMLVAPFLAILLADGLARVGAAAAQRWFRGALGLALALVAALLAGVATVDYQLGIAGVDVAMVAGTGLVMVVLASAGWRGGAWAAASCLAVTLFLLLPIALATGRHLLHPDQGAQIAASLAEMGCLRHGPIGFLGGPGLASKVRVCSGGQAQLVQLPVGPPDPLREHPVAIVQRDMAAALDPGGCVSLPVSAGYRDLPPARLAEAIVRGTLPEFLAEHREEFRLIIHTAPGDDLTPLPFPSLSSPPAGP